MSTVEAREGAETTAGSSQIDRASSGSIEPISVAEKTWINNEAQTAIASFG